MSGHTPSELPWRQEDRFIVSADGRPLADTHYFHIPNKGNIALILEAVNSHAANEAKIEALTAALEGRKAAILAERDLHRWTNEDSAWHRAFGELSGLNYALEEMRVAALTSAGEK